MKIRETYCDKCDCMIDEGSPKHYEMVGYRWKKTVWGSSRKPFGDIIDLCPTCYKKIMEYLLPKVYLDKED